MRIEKVLCKIKRDKDVATFLLIKIANKRVALFEYWVKDDGSIPSASIPLSPLYTS